MLVWILIAVFVDIAALLLIGWRVHRFLRRRQIAAESRSIAPEERTKED